MAVVTFTKRMNSAGFSFIHIPSTHTSLSIFIGVDGLIVVHLNLERRILLILVKRNPNRGQVTLIGAHNSRHKMYCPELRCACKADRSSTAPRYESQGS